MGAAGSSIELSFQKLDDFRYSHRLKSSLQTSCKSLPRSTFPTCRIEMKDPAAIFRKSLDLSRTRRSLLTSALESGHDPKIDVRTALYKRQVRKEMCKRLHDIPRKSIISQSEIVARRLRNLEWYKEAKNIGFYAKPYPGEGKKRNDLEVGILSDKMIYNAFEDGKNVFLPRITPTIDMKPENLEYLQTVLRLATKYSEYLPFFFLEMSQIENYEQSRQLIDNYNPKKPVKDPPPGFDPFDSAGLDMIIVPGVAYNNKGMRLGRGQGFYDNYIFFHRAWSLNQNLPIPSVIGMALEEQLYPDHERIYGPNDKRFLPRTTADTPVFRSVLSETELQQVEKRIPAFVPHTQHDVYMDLVLTPSREYGILEQEVRASEEGMNKEDGSAGFVNIP
ncbi:5-formyltetrahydrofolate cyclo-ligase family-domain-containing protein [Myxozyma melibiosi]|uniref:5-formyltetrahydrofolate cyclo-ligase n=1 Tax=Myxozyma melibiosi TaxID=54550 RepID=A0ABR1F9W7_9ASCO